MLDLFHKKTRRPYSVLDTTEKVSDGADAAGVTLFTHKSERRSSDMNQSAERLLSQHFDLSK